MMGPARPPSTFMERNAKSGLVKTICNVSMNALNQPFCSRSSQGSPVRETGASAAAPIVAGVIVDVATGGGGSGTGAAPISAENSANCESGCQLAMPSRQPRSVARNRPERSPSRTSCSEKTPSVLAPRLMWIAITARFNEPRPQSQSAFNSGIRRARLATANPVADGRALALRVNREMFVLKTLGNALCLLQLDLFGRGVERVVGFAALFRAAHVGGRVRQRNPCLRQTDEFNRLLGGDRQR